MAASSKRAKASAKKASEAAASLRENPYVQRLIEDEELRDNIRDAVEAARDAYARIANGKGPAKAIMEDKKVQKDLRKAAESLRDASEALRGKRKKSPPRADHPDRPHRRGHRAAAQRGHPQGPARQALRGRGGVRVLLDDLAHAGDAGGHEELGSANELREAAGPGGFCWVEAGAATRRGPVDGFAAPQGPPGGTPPYPAAVAARPRPPIGSRPMASVHVLIPAQRYVFSLDGERAEPEQVSSSAEGFTRYKELQAEGKAVGMVAMPNTVLVRGERDYLVDPGLIMQGAPLFSALGDLGVDANEIKDVILTHLHFDHAEGMAAWPQRRTFVHRIETEAPYAQIVAGQLEMANLEVVDGEEGEIEPGVRWMLTPGPLRRPDHDPRRHRRRPRRDRVRLRRPAARVLRRDGPSRGLRARARGAAAPVAADPRPRPCDGHPRA